VPTVPSILGVRTFSETRPVASGTPLGEWQPQPITITPTLRVLLSDNVAGIDIGIEYNGVQFVVPIGHNDVRVPVATIVSVFGLKSRAVTALMKSWNENCSPISAEFSFLPGHHSTQRDKSLPPWTQTSFLQKRTTNSYTVADVITVLRQAAERGTYYNPKFKLFTDSFLGIVGVVQSMTLDYRENSIWQVPTGVPTGTPWCVWKRVGTSWSCTVHPSLPGSRPPHGVELPWNTYRISMGESAHVPTKKHTRSVASGELPDEWQARPVNTTSTLRVLLLDHGKDTDMGIEYNGVKFVVPTGQSSARVPVATIVSVFGLHSSAVYPLMSHCSSISSEFSFTPGLSTSTKNELLPSWTQTLFLKKRLTNSYTVADVVRVLGERNRPLGLYYNPKFKQFVESFLGIVDVVQKITQYYRRYNIWQVPTGIPLCVWQQVETSWSSTFHPLGPESPPNRVVLPWETYKHSMGASAHVPAKRLTLFSHQKFPAQGPCSLALYTWVKCKWDMAADLDQQQRTLMSMVPSLLTSAGYRQHVTPSMENQDSMHQFLENTRAFSWNSTFAPYQPTPHNVGAETMSTHIQQNSRGNDALSSVAMGVEETKNPMLTMPDTYHAEQPEKAVASSTGSPVMRVLLRVAESDSVVAIEYQDALFFLPRASNVLCVSTGTIERCCQFPPGLTTVKWMGDKCLKSTVKKEFIQQARHKLSKTTHATLKDKWMLPVSRLTTTRLVGYTLASVNMRAKNKVVYRGGYDNPLLQQFITDLTVLESQVSDVLSSLFTWFSSSSTPRVPAIPTGRDSDFLQQNFPLLRLVVIQEQLPNTSKKKLRNTWSVVQQHVPSPTATPSHRADPPVHHPTGPVYFTAVPTVRVVVFFAGVVELALVVNGLEFLVLRKPTLHPPETNRLLVRNKTIGRVLGVTNRASNKWANKSPAMDKSSLQLIFPRGYEMEGLGAQPSWNFEPFHVGHQRFVAFPASQVTRKMQRSHVDTERYTAFVAIVSSASLYLSSFESSKAGHFPMFIPTGVRACQWTQNHDLSWSLQVLSQPLASGETELTVSYPWDGPTTTNQDVGASSSGSGASSSGSGASSSESGASSSVVRFPDCDDSCDAGVYTYIHALWKLPPSNMDVGNHFYWDMIPSLLTSAGYRHFLQDLLQRMKDSKTDKAFRPALLNRTQEFFVDPSYAPEERRRIL
jgi:hypothetical protein